MDISTIFYYATTWLYLGIYLGVGACGIIGAVLVIFTRDDAFTAADRHPKFVWALMLFVSALVLLKPMAGLNFFAWIGAVVIGLYWFDVRPQIRRILDGDYNY